MQKHIIGSAAFHVAVFVVGYVSFPAFQKDLPPLETPIIVDVVEIGEKTNVPPSQPTPAPKQEPEKAAPPPPPQAKAPPPPPPPPPPAPKQVAALPPEPVKAEPKPEPAPKPEAKLPEPKPEPKPEAKPEQPKVPPSLSNAKPLKKPKAPDDFASVLKTVENLKPQPQQAKKEPEPKKETAKKPEPKETFDAAIAKALASNTTKFNPNERVSISEMDAIRRQIRECWNLQAGAKGAESITTDIRVWMNQDGTVQRAQIQDSLRANTDPYYRAVAESALRAVLNPKCQPFKLPAEKYNEWSTMILAFDPREMF